jgi:iron(III) transport system permease protein
MRRLVIPSVLLGISAAPLIFIILSARGAVRVDGGSFMNSAIFACVGASIAVVLGGAEAIVLAMTNAKGHVLANAICVVPLAAPAAFWWLGLQRLGSFATTVFHGEGGAAVISGIALSPVPFLLVTAALHEIPSSALEAARLALPPPSRVVRVLLPMLRSAFIASFLLTTVILIGESELPFLFGFRTVMTDAVTEFARSFDAAEVAPMIVPVLVLVIALAMVMRGALLKTLLAPARGARGVRPTPQPWHLLAAAPILLLLGASIAGHLSGLTRGGAFDIQRVGAVAATSIAEAVVWSWITVGAAIVVVYPIRRSPQLRWMLSIAVVLFAAPSAFFAIGCVAFSQRAGVDVPVGAAHFCRLLGLAIIAFAAAYTRIPRSVDDAAQLVPMSSILRAHRFVLPLLGASSAATALLVATMILSDRDVASVLLPAGAERLMLDLYLTAANAPAFVVSAWAVAVLGSAIIVAVASGAGPWLLWRRRG